MEPTVRKRLFDALLRELADGGRSAMNLKLALREAGVSRSAFTAEFSGLDEALDAAYDHLAGATLDAVRAGCLPDDPWATQVRASLEGLLSTLAEDPRRAAVLVLAYPSTGPEARARYQAFLDQLAQRLDAHLERLPAGNGLPAEIAIFAVGSAEVLISDAIARGETESLPSMAPEIGFSVLVPFLGPSDAIVEMEAARRRLS